jgi:hypothetical protein
MSRTKFGLLITSLLLIISLACSVSINSGGEQTSVPSEAEQTLSAIYSGYTAEALSQPQQASQEAAQETPAAEQPAPTEITHTIIPGNPGSPDQEKDEIDTSNTAADRLALGDSFRLGNFERPFTQDSMVYKQENDLFYLELSEDDDFYIFSLELIGPGEDGTLSAHYGIEFDSDKDGRGDVLLWAKGGDHPDWTIEDVMVLRDSNNDVGGSSPVVPDSRNGDGYDEVLFSADVLDDPDAAWQRIDPNNSNIIQLAIKKGLIDEGRFFWKGWADSGVADPSKFDYNDSFSEEQAGSPNKNSSYYPVGQLNLMDSTCWVAYNFEASGKELGGCYQLAPEPTKKPPTQVPCSGSCNTGTSQRCCTCAGWHWTADGCRLIPPS